MATIGTITVEFAADLLGLKEGIAESLDLFEELSDSIDSLSEQIEEASSGAIKIKAEMDASSLAKASKDVSSLSDNAAVKVVADTSSAERSVSRLTSFLSSLRQSMTQMPGVTGAAAGETIRFAENAEKAGKASDSLATKMRRGADVALLGATGQAAADAKEYANEAANAAAVTGRVSSAASSAASAIRGLADASSLAARGDSTLVSGIDKTIIAVGRSRNAYIAAGSAIGATAAAMGGTSTASAALAGSAAATAISVGSLAGAVVGGAASLGTYSAIMAVARQATSGLSEEARRYVDAAAQIGAVSVSAVAGVRASAATYAAVSSALFRSASASQFFQNAIQSLGAAVASGASLLSGLAAVLGKVLPAIELVSGAANKEISLAQYAALAARVTATSAAFGAASGALRAFSAGTAVASGAATGAAAAVAGIVSSLPLVVPVAIAAAVATGRFTHELEEMSLQAQSIDQMASRFGSSIEEMTKLRMAAANTNVSMGQLAKGQQAFYTSLSKIKAGQLNVENVREAKLAYDKLNISIDELKSLKPEEAFKKVAKELSEVKDPAERTAIAFDLFGKQGAAILPALKELGELEEDFKRLGGAMNEVNFARFLTLETSFDRIHAASATLRQVIVLPFVELQKAFNNATADIRGGLASALAPVMTMLADMTKPLAVVIEMIGRMINVALRLIGIIAQVAAYFQIFASVAKLFEGIGEGFLAAMRPLEELVGLLTSGGSEASAFAAVMDGLMSAVKAVGSAIGFIIGLVANLAVGLGVAAAAYGIYTAATALASATSLGAAVSFATAWAAAIAPITVVVGVLAALGAGVLLVASAVTSGVKRLYSFAQSLGLIPKEREKIDATKASVEELAAASQIAAEVSRTMSFFPKDGAAAGLDDIKSSVETARGRIGDLTIEAAKFGQAGADAASASQGEFNKLQQKLAEGTVTVEQFDAEAKKLGDNLKSNLDTLKSDAPEVTLKKNLELYKQLDDAAKSASKATREIGAGTVIDDKFFPTSEEIKSRAAQYKAEYIKALEEIKKKQQSGGFAADIKQKQERNKADFEAGRISREQFETVKLELDSTNAQEQASIAAEEVKREFDKKTKIDIELDMSFADSVRKSLDSAFLTPVDKFDKELKKIKDNKSLNVIEKAMAERDLRIKVSESLVGKSAQSQFQERTSELRQAGAAGLISEGKMNDELEKAAADFAKAVGVTQTPFEAFSSSLNNIASQFGMAGQPIDQVREKLSGNAEQLAMFDRAVKESRDNLLSSLGIEKTPQAIFDEQMKKIDEAVNATDPNKRITQEQAGEARAAATRKRDEALGAGADIAGQLRDRQRKIEEAYGGGKDPDRMAIAQNKLAIDRRSAAGLDATPAQALQAGVDKVNDAFGVTGKSMEEVRAALSPEEFKEYQEAIKKNSDSVKASLGVEKTGAEKIGEARAKLAKAVSDGVITEGEKNKALKEQRDSLLSSLGIKKTPSQDFEDAVKKIKENASELSPEEIAKGLKEAKDNLLSSLGVDKSPAQQASESMKKLREAFDKGQISASEFAKGSQKARDTLLQSLGIPLNPVTQLRQRLDDLNEAFSRGEITQEEFKRGQEEARRSMIPGGEAESPVKKFQRDMKSIDQALSEGLIDDKDAAMRKANLQAQLQEDLKPSLDRIAPDRRGIEASDVRSKGGVDTFFRILRGNDNPSLKAQLEIARNTKVLAEAAKEPNAAPVIAQLSAK